jgi:phosphate transport system substrate-binding protein
LPLLLTSSGCVEEKIQIHGAGATFPAPLYARWVALFNRANPELEVHYEPRGSGAGIKAITDRHVHFGASDVLLSESDRRYLPGELLTIPTAGGPVVLAYNLPRLEGDLVLDGAAVADIYLGKVTAWNDPRLRVLNPDLDLPELPIHVAHRSDKSGTTAIFTDYLSAVSEDWRKRIGRGPLVRWPTGDEWSGIGNDGVAHRILLLPGGIGYVGIQYAKNAGLSYTSLINNEGNVVRPTVEAVQAAVRHGKTLPGGLIAPSLVNSPGEDSYPICGFTYLLVYQDLRYLEVPEVGKGLVRFLRWALTEGQESSLALHYTPLPEEMRRKALQLVDTIRTTGAE